MRQTSWEMKKWMISRLETIKFNLNVCAKKPICLFDDGKINDYFSFGWTIDLMTHRAAFVQSERYMCVRLECN